jgi:hypothetical protein
VLISSRLVDATKKRFLAFSKAVRILENHKIYCK